MKQVGAALIGLLAAVVCVSLGLWQLSRLEDRQASNAVVEASLSRTPVRLDRALPDDTLAFRRAVAHGVFDFERQVVLMARSWRGVPGVHVVTPLRLPTGDAVLVERGYVPSPDGRSVDLNLISETDSSTVTGVLLPVVDDGTVAWDDVAWPLYRRRADPVRLQSAYSYRLLPYLLRRTHAPRDMPGTLSVLPEPELSNGPHLSYAIQWFSFAAIAAVGTFILLAKSRKTEVGEHG